MLKKRDFELKNKHVEQQKNISGRFKKSGTAKKLNVLVVQQKKREEFLKSGDVKLGLQLSVLDWKHKKKNARIDKLVRNLMIK